MADSLRKETLRRSRALSPTERVALALELGSADLEAYRRARGLDPRVAAIELGRRRQLGRARSAAMEALLQ